MTTTTTTTTTSRPTAYSYVRFSTPEQEKGDSIRRQVELRDEWLKRSGAVLDTTLNMHDRGVSAFNGKHRANPDRHALAAFLELVRRCRVERGSFLVVESLDRLSREHIRPALTLLLNLIDAGVRVVQLLPVEQVFGEDVEPMVLMMAIMELSRGHSESTMKSERLGRSWEKKRKEAAAGKTISRKLPGWIVAKNDERVLEPKRAEVVRRMFTLAAEGNGVAAIVQRLNREKVPTFGRSKTWAVSTVYMILTSPATMGTYQPRTECGTAGKRLPAGDPIPGYFPAVVDERTFYVVQQRLRDKNKKGGRRGAHVNIFSGLLKDARDGGAITYNHAKRRPSSIVPQNARHGIPGSE